MDFKVIKIKNPNVFLIFGRPLLATSRTKIDVEEEMLELLSEDGLPT